jgi:hypothetical protein
MVRKSANKLTPNISGATALASHKLIAFRDNAIHEIYYAAVRIFPSHCDLRIIGMNHAQKKNSYNSIM